MTLKSKRTYLALALGTALLSGCSATTDPTVSFKPPKYVEELPSKEDEMSFGNLGSLYGQGDNPLFSDRKAMKVNDIVTIVISETAQATSSSNKELSDDTSIGLGGPSFTYDGHQNKPYTPEWALRNLNNYSKIGASMSSSNSFDGSGDKSRNESFTTTISARIIKVMNNGNYYIEGGREILIDGEKQDIRIAGVIRPYDIGQDNSIDSKYIADAKIFYETEGDLKKTTEKKWGTKLVEAVWPF